jgi:hypothetical protein
MSFPRIFTLILFGILAVTTITTANMNAVGGSAPQRLRVRVENQQLKSGETTKVIVEFLDRDYGQVANDATRTIELGHAATRSRNIGSGKFNQPSILVKPGETSGEAWFTSTQPGRLLLTANSEGLEAGQALVLITSATSASLLSRFVSLFETTAHAQDDLGFEISHRKLTATAGGQHRATFNVSFLESPKPGTVVRITTNLTNGEILYKNQRVGSTIADIPLDEGQAISGDISIRSRQPGTFDITASVRPDGPVDQAQVEFTPPRPEKIIFDAEPTTIGTEECKVPLTVRLADEGGFPIEPVGPTTIHFNRATESDQIIFEPESVVVAPGRASAQVVFRLRELPLGNEIKLLATTDQGISAGQKSLVIKSEIEKVMISGPPQVHRGGGETEYTVYLADKDGKQRAADWNRQIDLNVNGGSLSTAQVVIPKGARKAVVKYSSAADVGKYVLTASSGGIGDASYTIGVISQNYWLVLFALLGGLIGGVARQLHKHKNFGRIRPRWTGKHWDLGFSGRIAGSLVSALFLYWTFKLGISQALGSPALPAALDLGTRTVAFFLGGIGGFAGTVVLDNLTKWFMPGQKPRTATAQ